MNNRIICPYCRNSTDISNRSTCVYCGKRLKGSKPKIIEGAKPNNKNFTTNNKGVEGSGSGCFAVIAIILCIILSIVYNKGCSPDSKKINKVHETMKSTINQNDKFNLPTQVSAEMENGKSKAVDIVWDTNSSFDTSTVGDKVISGKVEGYSKPISYTITVLPNPIINGFYDVNTQNSIINYNVKLKKTIKWVWFKMSKDGQVRNQTIPVNQGVMNNSLYLSLGSGIYEIEVLANKDSDEYSNYYSIGNIKINNTDKRNMDRLMPSRYVESDSVEIIKLANEITKGAYSDMERTKAIHDWIATNIAYDVVALDSGNVRIYSALDTLHGKKAVCNGYANLTAALNRAIGIKTKIIHGTAKSSRNDNSNNGHAWNETYIDDRWIIQDTTWDAGGVDNKRKFEFELDHKYFDPKPDKFEKDHTKNSEKDE